MLEFIISSKSFLGFVKGVLVESFIIVLLLIIHLDYSLILHDFPPNKNRYLYMNWPSK
jgi:hypothetical protein